MQRVRRRTRRFRVDRAARQLRIQRRLSHQSVHQLPVRGADRRTGLPQLASDRGAEAQRHVPSIGGVVRRRRRRPRVDPVDSQHHARRLRHCQHLHRRPRRRARLARRRHPTGTCIQVTCIALRYAQPTHSTTYRRYINCTPSLL